MLMRKHIPIFFLAALFLAPFIAHSDESLRPGLFVSVLDKNPVFSSKEQIKGMIDYAKGAGIKVLFVQVYRANKAWFNSKVADVAPYRRCLKDLGEDPLTFIIKEAHGQGLEVHAWLNMLSLSQNKEAPMLKKYGMGILTRNLTPKKTLEDYKIDNQYFLEPSDARVRKDLLSIVGELVEHYPSLDGVQFDYIRYPDVQPFYGYSKANMDAFKKKTGVRKIDEQDFSWRQWKRDQVTALVKALTAKARSINGKIAVSVTGCVSYVRAMEEAFQEWPRWINEGIVDFVTIMSYPPDAATFKKNVADALKRVNDPSKMNIAIGAYKMMQTPEIYKEQFDICKATKAGACVVFHYDSLRESKALADITREEGK